MKIVALGGSPAPNSRTGRLLDYIATRLAPEGFHIETIHVRDLPAQALLHADHAHPKIAATLKQVEQADGVVIATPVYKAAYSGILKTFLDLLPQYGLKGKVVLPLAIGGTPAHLLVLDYALRPVLASLAPRQILDSVYAVDQQIAWTDADGLRLDPPIAQRVHDGVDNLIGSLRPPRALLSDLHPRGAPVPALQP